MMTRDHDAIVVGASFAGLAVARRLRGRVLLLDRHEVGEIQTSACGTPLWVPQALGVADSVLQVHRRAVVHAPTRTVVYDLGDVPYCTFDYRRFCRGYFTRQTRASSAPRSPGFATTWSRPRLAGSRPAVSSTARGGEGC